MPDLSPATVAAALDGEPPALRTLVDALAPVVHARVVQGLYRYRFLARRRDVAQEADDMVQEVFAALFDDGGRALRAWAPERGLPLEGFVGLLARRQVASILRSGRRSPWTEDATEFEEMDATGAGAPDPETVVVGVDVSERLVEGLERVLSPRGLELFHQMFVLGLSVEEIAALHGLRPDAIYAWRSRIAKAAREVLSKLDEGTMRAAPHPPADTKGARR